MKADPPLPPLVLGIPAPTVPPDVIPAPYLVTLNTINATPVGGTTLYFAGNSTADVLVGMSAVDLQDHRLTATTTAAAAAGTTLLTFSSTGSGSTAILPGMTVKCQDDPAIVFPGTKVVAVSATQVRISINLSNPVIIGNVFQFDNINQLPSSALVTAKGDLASGQVTISDGAIAAGVQTGDLIEFVSPVPETRAYLYTYVTTYSEESEESPATVKTGDPTGLWSITIPAPPAGYNTNRAITRVRLYRLVTDADGNGTYYEVVTVPLNASGPTHIDDIALSEDIIGHLVLGTVGYSPPPVGLQGVVMMANGIAAGFTNSREIWFSAAYLPHAWPGAYSLTVDYPVVGLSANGTSLNIMTEGSPFIATGVTPDTMTIGKISANEPCISRGSIVGAGEGAYYASPNGVQLLNTGGTETVTQGVYEKEFHNSLAPTQWASCKYGSSYAGFIKGAPLPSGDGIGYHGFVMDNPSVNPNVPFTYLRFPVKVVNAYSDELSGQIFGLMEDRSIQQWNPPVGKKGTTFLRAWQWKTKQFRFTMPQMFKAFMVLFEVPGEVGFMPGMRNTDQYQNYDPTTQYLLLRVYADGKLVVVREIQRSGEVLLIPGGFKAELWEFLFEGIVGLKFFKVASSVKELKAA